MKFMRQQQRLDVSATLAEVKKDSRIKNGPLLPENIRAIVAGSSGCGKTQLVINLLTQANGLKFENIYVYSKTLFQPKYVLLKEIMKCLPEIQYFAIEHEADLISPKDALANSVMIYDDVLVGCQKNQREFFCMSRHKNIDVFYLTQCYAQVEKHLIRENANLIVLFKMDKTNMRHVYENHCSSDLSFDQFVAMCRACWEEKFGFLTIDIECDVKHGRFRRGFDTFIIV